MSETPKIPSADIKKWLEKESGSTFGPVHSKAEKFRNEMKKELEGLLQSSKMLYENSGKEIEKRNAKTYRRARALNKLSRLFVERVQQAKAPEKVLYDTMHDYAEKTQETLVTMDIDVRNWFPHVSPFFIIDRRKFLLSLERAKAQLKEVNGFLSKEYVKTKTLEKTFDYAEELSSLERRQKSFEAQKTRISNEKAALDKAIQAIQNEITELKCKGDISQLDQTFSEIETFGTEVRHSLQHLQKPFIKMQSLSLHGGGSGLTPDELGKLDEYLTNPFESLATEDPGYPVLKEILSKLQKALDEDKLKLKPEKVRKAQQTIGDILDRLSIAELQRKCRDARARRNRLQASPELAETERQLSKLREHLEEQERKGRVLETEKVAVDQNLKRTYEEIQRHKSEIEKNILSFTNKRVIIQ